MTAVVLGRRRWEMTRSKEGEREYKLELLVQTDSYLDGPETILGASGMPSVGSTWTWGNDNDPWAFCQPTFRASCLVNDEPYNFWTAELTYSTKARDRCQDASVEDPLLEPAGVSGSFVELQRKLLVDRLGKPILSSSHEPIVGLERDSSNLSITIEQNVASLNLPLIAGRIHNLNDASLWGMSAGRIKLSRAGFSRKVYGLCNYYYTLTLEFDIRFEGFDETEIADVGYKVYSGEGGTANPENYIVAKDGADENSPERILLNGQGGALTDKNNPVFIPPIEIYTRSNLLELGIPSSI